MTNINIGRDTKWFVFAAGMLAGALPSFGALTAWVWSGPGKIEDYYATPGLHESANTTVNSSVYAIWPFLALFASGLIVFCFFKFVHKRGYK